MKISEHNKELYEREFYNYKTYHKVHGDKIKKMIRLVSSSPKKILDIGCGDGWTGKLLKDEYKAEVHGVDIAEKALKSAKKKGLKTKKFDLAKSKWPYKDDYFDLIIAGDIIEHVYDTENFVKECHRILKKGGELIISTPNINSYQNRFLVLIGKMPLWIDYAPNLKSYKHYKTTGHVRVFNKKTLTRLLETYGFKVDKLTGAGLVGDAELMNLPKTVVKIGNKIEKFLSHFTSIASLLIIKVVK
ncbi:methyltransferase domain-containing protein [archaeon]|nr:methyltransferase domain-containing protein [archaeon]